MEREKQPSVIRIQKTIVIGNDILLDTVSAIFLDDLPPDLSAHGLGVINLDVVKSDGSDKFVDIAAEVTLQHRTVGEDVCQSNGFSPPERASALLALNKRFLGNADDNGHLILSKTIFSSYQLKDMGDAFCKFVSIHSVILHYI